MLLHGFSHGVVLHGIFHGKYPLTSGNIFRKLLCQIFEMQFLLPVLLHLRKHHPTKNPQHQQVQRIEHIEKPLVKRLFAAAFAVVAILY